MSDQADRLRQLAVASRATRKREGPGPDVDHDPYASASGQARTARALLFTSGKGGVGTSNLTLNLAVALGELGRRVLLIDADIGLANLDLLCGLAPRFDLGDVLAGRCRLEEAIIPGPCGIQIIPGAHAIRTGSSALDDGPARLVEELRELESESDFVLVDAGSGLGPGAVELATAVDAVVIVTTPEPTSMADAHAAIGRFRRLPAPPRLRVVVNQVRTSAEAMEVLDRLSTSCRQFLGTVVTPLGPGAVRADPNVGRAVRNRWPFVLAYPTAPASLGVRRLARALIREQLRPTRKGRRFGFFVGLAARWAPGLVATG